MSDERPRAVVFDLDGTLIDSLPDIVASFRAAFDDQGLPAPDAGAVRAQIGRPLEAMIAAFAPDRVAGVAAAYRRIYPERFLETTAPFPGATAVLETLRARGLRTVVATTKRTAMARELVAAVGLAPYLDHVQGTDDLPAKPAPDVVWAAAAAVGADATWMVGDTVHDLEAGRAAGVATYAVTWGTHDAATLRRAAPDVLEPDLGALPACVGDGRTGPDGGAW